MLVFKGLNKITNFDRNPFKKQQCCSKCSLSNYHTKFSKDLLTPEITQILLEGTRNGMKIEEFDIVFEIVDQETCGPYFLGISFP